ncbi:MAG: YebC/PmpR family DNA-binding transcriptional regulator [Deltaproteobacteria bacterium]|nr:YebC/PmpR family DNA-binding transcriptional regulator [Deltaproteobacteria bacterium]
MSGHSKWANIKHKKTAVDAKRGKIFTKLIKELTVAARSGGGDPGANPRLRTAIAEAKNQNMPKDNMERAIKKGTGELEGIAYEEITYEGYGPGGAAILIESLSDNKNRTAADIRHILSKNGGNLGENGSVSWIFDKKGYIVIEKKAVNEEKLMEAALEAGAEDVREDEDNFEIITEAGEFEKVKEAMDKEKFIYILSEVTMLPSNSAPLEEADAEKIIKLIDALEDCDDVQKVYTNADI